jgi:regulatory protein YycI of two-component signal transduction system YycFG
LSMKERIIWIFSILIFNIFAILAFFIWKKNKQEV